TLKAPAVLLSWYQRLRLSARKGGSSVRALPLLTRLLKDNTLWKKLDGKISVQPRKEQIVAYQAIWSAIHYAWVRAKYPVVPRRELQTAMFRIGQGLQRAGKAIAPYFPDRTPSAKSNPETQKHKKKEKLWA